MSSNTPWYYTMMWSFRSSFLEKGEKYMNRKYTKDEIKALQFIYRTHRRIFYVNNFDIESEFYALTGVDRKSGPLYMAYWRYTKGQYDQLLAS